MYSSADIKTANTEFHAQQFHMLSLLNRINTTKIVRIEAVDKAKGTVDILPMVSMILADGTEQPHSVIYNVPFFRVLGGKNAVIVNPEVGDIGLAAFCDRDIKIVKKTRKISRPASRNTYHLEDAVYIGGMPQLNDAPNQTITIDSNGITIDTPIATTINTPKATINAKQVLDVIAPVANFSGVVNVSGALNASTAINANTISASGNISTSSDLNVAGNIGSSGGGGLSIGGTLSVNGLVVNGDAAINGALRNNGILTGSTHKHFVTAVGAQTGAPV